MLLIILFCFGLILGSFFNVCIYRLPQGNFWESHRSFCPHCKTTIAWYHNIPVFSFLALRGKAACCGKKISWQYPIVELLSGLILVGIYWKFPFLQHAAEGHGVYTKDLIRFVHASLFTYLLLVCTFIDLEHMIIPDLISLPMILLAPLIPLLHPELTLKSCLLGIFLGGGIIYTIAWTYFLITRREGMGMGDAKLLAAIGGWLGFEGVFPTLIYGSILGSICGILWMILNRKLALRKEIPFGPYLAIGALLHFFSKVSLLRYF